MSDVRYHARTVWLDDFCKPHHKSPPPVLQMIEISNIGDRSTEVWTKQCQRRYSIIYQTFEVEVWHNTEQKLTGYAIRVSSFRPERESKCFSLRELFSHPDQLGEPRC